MVECSSAVFDLAVERVDVHLHLAQVRVRQTAELQINQHITPQQPVVEHEVHEEVLAVKREPLLPGLEQKTLAQLQQEPLDLAEDRGFEVRFGIPRLLVEAEELQDQRLFQQVIDALHDLPFVSQLADAVFVPAEREAFVKTAVELALEFADFPILRGGFDLVEAALIGILDAEQEDVVRPAQSEGAWLDLSRRGQLPRQRLGNLELASQ